MKKLILLFPKITIILIAAFFFVIGLDVFAATDITFLEKLFDYLIHVIPALLLLASLLIARKRPDIGGMALITLAVTGFFFFHAYRNIFVFLIATALPFCAGAILIAANRGKNEDCSTDYST